ncbi:MAG: apolipoprotein N-acyltransferase [Myxococcota bacterium]
MTGRNRNRRRTETSIPVGPDAPTRVVGRRQTIQDLWWLIFGGCLTFVAFPFRTTPDSEIWPLAWVGLIPLLWRLRGVSRRRAFWYGAVYGLVVNFGGFWWMSGMFEEFGHLPAVVAWAITLLNAVYQGMMFAVFAAVVVWLGRKEARLPGPLVLASAFVAVEYLYPMVFPWYLGNSQHPFRWFVQVADLGGVYGVSFLVVVGNALGLTVIERVSKRHIYLVQAGVGALLIVSAIGYGATRLQAVDEAAERAPKMKIGMVEADIGIWEKEAKGLARNKRAQTLHSNLLKHQSMSRDLAERGAELILWPESSYIPLGPVYGKRLDSFAVGIGDSGRLALWRDHGEAGFDWSLGPTIADVGTPFRAVAASREDTVFAVGDNGAVISWDGKHARPVPIQVLEGEGPPALFGVAVGAESGGQADADGGQPVVWAVGQHGHVYVGDGLGLDLIASEVSTSLRAVATLTGGRAIAVGDAGVVLALEKRSNSRIDTHVDSDLYAVVYDPATRDVWVAGAGGTILTAKGARWSREKTGVTTTLRALAVDDHGTVFAVGDHGTILRREPSGAWVQESIPTKSHLVSVTADARGTMLAADRAGGLWIRSTLTVGLWERVDAPGIGPLHSMASLGYVRMRPIPRDTRYLIQGEAPGPEAEAFLRRPGGEMSGSNRVRTAVQRGFKTPIIFGAITWESSEGEGRANRRVWNTAVLLDEMGRIRGMYDKYQLLAFGEYIPFGEVFPSLYGLIPEAGRFVAGDDVGAFDFMGHKLGLMICYEDILTRFAGRLAGLEPEVLLNITNDAWFGRTSEPYLHLNLAMMRAIETHRPLLRSTNTGISTIVDPAGRLVQQSSIDDAETLMADVPMMTIGTVYARIGDLFAHITLLHMLCLFLLRRTRRSS